MKRFLLILFIIMGLGLVSATASDDDPLLKAIKARQGIMKNYSWNAGPLFGMAKGDIEYNAETAMAHTNNLKSLSMLNNGSQWPEGSDDDAYPDDTNALEKIWSTDANVADKSQALVDAATAMAEIAGNGLQALQSKIGDVGDACKGCHDDFRAEID